MKRLFLLPVGALTVLGVLQACSSADVTPPGGLDSGKDVGATDSSTIPDTNTVDASDSGACPGTWTAAPIVDPSLALPDGGGVLLHGAATGTQDYQCQASADDAGTPVYKWTAIGPEADLADCASKKFATHFASDAGATRPEWMITADNGYVIAKKTAGYTPDGGASAVPWLLLAATEHGGTGPITKTNWIHRTNTTGGLAPSTVCDVNAVGTVTKVPYTADYYFYGQ